jgi:LacI family gluconate utilization system Gnt-I transcriptional repressor
MADVARQAGVSAITVSRALRDPGLVRPATRERIEAAIARLGYVPDLVAGALASKRSRIVAVVVPTFAGSVFAETIQGLMDVLRPAGHEILLGATDYSVARERDLVAAFLGRRPDGVVLTGTAHAADTRRMLADAGCPVVETWDLGGSPIDSAVGFSNRAAGRALTLALAGWGYRRVAFASGPLEGDDRAAARREGYEAAAREAGLAPGLAVETERLPPPERGRRMLDALRARAPGVDAVICASDVLAISVLFEAIRRGLRVPDDLAVAGFGNFGMAGEVVPALTTVDVRSYEIGRRSAEVLLGRLVGAAADPVVHDVGFEIVRRATA